MCEVAGYGFVDVVADEVFAFKKLGVVSVSLIQVIRTDV
jgi:hypothetical protein